MSTRKILDEMLKAADLDEPKGFDGEDQEFLDKLSDQLSGLDDDEYEELSEEAQDYANKMIRAANDSQTIPGFEIKAKRSRRTKKDDDDGDDRPKRARRSKSDDDDDDDQPKRRGKKKTSKDELEWGELEKDMENVTLVSSKGREATGKVIEISRKECWLETDDGEEGFYKDKTESIYVEVESKDDDDDDDQPKRRGKSDDDDDDDDPPKKSGRGRKPSGQPTKVQRIVKTLYENPGKNDERVASICNKAGDTTNADVIKRYRSLLKWVFELAEVDWS